MISYRFEVAIARTPSDVFPYLADLAKQALYSDVPMRLITPGTLTTGSRMEVTFGKGPLKAVLGLEMTALEQDKRIAFTTYSGPIRWQGEYRLKPTDSGGTSLSHDGTLVFTGLWRLLEPLVVSEIKRDKELERLKAVVEGA